MLTANPQQNLKSHEELKEECDGYVELLEQIDNESNPTKAAELQKKADEVFKQFTPKMKQYCEMKKNLKLAKANVLANKVQQLEKINKQMQQIQMDVKQQGQQFHKELNSILQQRPQQYLASEQLHTASDQERESLLKFQAQAQVRRPR